MSESGGFLTHTKLSRFWACCTTQKSYSRFLKKTITTCTCTCKNTMTHKTNNNNKRSIELVINFIKFFHSKQKGDIQKTRTRISVYIVVQLNPWFTFSFLLFPTHYHTLPYPKTTKKKIWTKDKIEPQIFSSLLESLHIAQLWIGGTSI